MLNVVPERGYSLTVFRLVCTLKQCNLALIALALSLLTQTHLTITVGQQHHILQLADSDMPGTSQLAEAPVEILSAIFALLPLRDKLRCESVCLNWSRLLRGSHAHSTLQLGRAIWGSKLRVCITGPMSFRDKIQIHQPAEIGSIAAVTLRAAETSRTATERAFVRWLTRVAPRLERLSVHFQYNVLNDEGIPNLGGWLFPRILTLLHLGRAAGPGPELHLTAGIFGVNGIPLLAL